MKTRSGWWSLVYGEPFRLLFPLGILIGLYGVLMWPLHVYGVSAVYPGPFHARIMVQAFLTSFVIGFLGTALPRLLEVPKLGRGWALLLAAGMLGVAFFHARMDLLAGNVLFLVTLGSFLVLLVSRAVRHRKDTPPPGFVLVGMGMLCALGGGGLQLAQSAGASLSAEVVSLSNLLLFHGYLLLPVMGIGAFLLPRFFGLPNRQSFPESLALPPGWAGRALFAAACGLAVLVSFFLEAWGGGRWAPLLRMVAILVYFFREVPVHQARFSGGAMAWGLRLALAAFPLGYGLMVAWPEEARAFLHIIFIGGFGLLTLTVATRVMLGHSGQSEKFRHWLWPVLVMTGLTFLALLMRVSAEFIPRIAMKHYAMGGLIWAVGVIIWAAWILPSVRRADDE